MAYYTYQNITDYLEDKTGIRDDLNKATERFLAKGGRVFIVPKKSTQELINDLRSGPSIPYRYMFGKDIKDITQFR